MKTVTIEFCPVDVTIDEKAERLKLVRKQNDEGIHNLEDFYNSEYFQAYEESFISGLGYSACPEKREMCNRIHEAAECGGEGRTHWEIIELWREALKACERDGLITERTFTKIGMEIDDCETWHCENGSIDNVIG